MAKRPGDGGAGQGCVGGGVIAVAEHGPCRVRAFDGAAATAALDMDTALRFKGAPSIPTTPGPQPTCRYTKQVK